MIFYIDNYARFLTFEKLFNFSVTDLFICEEKSTLQNLKKNGLFAMSPKDFDSWLSVRDKHGVIVYWNGRHTENIRRHQAQNDYLTKYFIENSGFTNLFFLDGEGVNSAISYYKENEFSNSLMSEKKLSSRSFLDYNKEVITEKQRMVQDELPIGREQYRRNLAEIIIDYDIGKIYDKILLLLYKCQSFINKLFGIFGPIRSSACLSSDILFLEQEYGDTSLEQEEFQLELRLSELGRDNVIAVRAHPLSKRKYWSRKYFENSYIVDDTIDLIEQARHFDKVYTFSSSAGIKLALSGIEVFYLGFSPFMVRPCILKKHLFCQSEIRDFFEKIKD